MPESHTALEIVGAGAAGLLAHWGFFIHGEKDLKAANIARVHLLAVFCAAYFASHFYNITLREALVYSLFLGVTYTASMLTSIIIYRLYLSPLCTIPGPLRMRISKLSHVWDQAHYRNCEILHDLHKTYGDVVRTGRCFS